MLTRAQRLGAPPSFFAGTSLLFFCLEFYFGNISNGLATGSIELLNLKKGSWTHNPLFSYLVTSMIDLGPDGWHLN